MAKPIAAQPRMDTPAQAKPRRSTRTPVGLLACSGPSGGSPWELASGCPGRKKRERECERTNSANADRHRTCDQKRENAKGRDQYSDKNHRPYDGVASLVMTSPPGFGEQLREPRASQCAEQRVRRRV